MIGLARIRESVLARNAGWMLLAQSAGLLTQGAYFFVLARLLGSAQYGLFIGATALVSIVSSFSSLGSGMVLLRYVSTDAKRFPEYWGHAISSTLLTGSLLVAIIGFAGPGLLHGGAPGMIIAIAIGDCICARLADCGGQAFQAVDRLRVTSLLNSITGLLRLLAAIILWIALGRASAAIWAIASLAVSAIAALVAVATVCAKIGAPRFRLRLFRERLAEGLGFSVAYSTTSIYNDVDKAMLAHYGMSAANGAYSVAYRIIDLACIPIRSLHAAALPHFFRAGAQAGGQNAAFSKRILKRTFPYGILAGIVLFVAAPLVTVFVGKDYSDAVPALQWLCLIPLLRTLHLSAGDAITSGGHQRLRTASQLGAAVLNFCLNLYFIPKWSWLGAAWSSLVTDGVLAAANWTILTLLVQRPTGQQSTIAQEIAA